MTSFITDIQTQLREVVTDYLSSAVQYRTLTSGYGVEPRTYSSWVTIAAVVTQQANTQEFDDNRGTFKRMDRIKIRTSDAVALITGAQFRFATSDAQIWAMESRTSTGPGSTMYTATRDLPTISSGGDRHGGV